MPDPLELISAARHLAGPGPSPIGDAHLRRAVSTAYYAVFHKILRTAADRFVGPNARATGAYAALYRAFDHALMRQMCEKLDVDTLSDTIKNKLGRTSVCQDTRDFAGAFHALQEFRHAADYDPQQAFNYTDVLSVIELAEIAMAAFDQIPPDERTDVIALLMVRTRG